MTLAPPAAATPQAPGTGPKPLLLPADLRLSAEQFALVCAANPGAVLELTADGQVIEMTPDQRRGFPPLCPDLVVELVSPSDGEPWGIQVLRRKLAAYLANGARLGWLLIPQQRAVEIWQAGADGAAAPQVQRIEAADVLEGGEQLPGLRLELAELWAG